MMTAQASGLTRYPQSLKDEAKALYAQGFTCYRISKLLGFGGHSDTLIRRWCDDDFRRAHNAEMNRRPRRGKRRKQ